MSNIARVMLDTARHHPERVAMIARHGSSWRQLTFGELLDRTGAYAEFLRREGIRPGERVMLMVRPSPEFICLAFALFALGAVVILIDPGMGYRNLLACIGAVKPATLIAIPRAQLFSRLFRRPFASVRRRLCVGRGLGLLGVELPAQPPAAQLTVAPSQDTDLAAIIFTTGSTGPPKGVRYEQRIFNAQLAMIRDHYRIGPGQVDQPAFPLFALFSLALGATAVIPDMDPTRPAKVNPAKFIRTINEYQVSYSFGSPAIWRVIARHCQERGLRLPSLKKVLMAGAPVPGELISRLAAILPEEAEIHVPYGATEALPIVSITGREVTGETWALTRQGQGVCLGRALPGIELRVIAMSDGHLAGERAVTPLPPGEVGEIVVRGPVVTAAYDHNESENWLAKIPVHDTLWHRMGDLGYLDESGRLWFCGRKAHRVTTRDGELYTICCEAIFNAHPLVARSALVGVGERGGQRPVLIVEPKGRVPDRERLFAELRELAKRHRHTAGIGDFMIHDSFPVDIRHNAKIFREKLAVWAAGRLSLNV